MDYPVKWDVVMKILGVLLGLVNNDGRHEALPICSCEYNSVGPEFYALSSLHLTHYFQSKELVSTQNLVPFTVGVKLNIITVPHLSGSWLDLMEVGWDDRSYLESKLVLMIAM